MNVAGRPNLAESMYTDAVAALNGAHWQRAAEIAQHMLREFGEHPAVHFVFGVAALEMRKISVAIAHLSRAVAMNADRPDYLTYLAKALAMGGSFREAGEAADRALAMQPQDSLLLTTLGVVYTEAGNHPAAAGAFMQSVARQPHQANNRFNLASALLYAGELDRAEQEYEACLANDERFWKAYPALSSLRRQHVESNHVERLQRMLVRHGDDETARLYLNFALAKEYEDLEDYASAFKHYSESKRAGGMHQKYSVDEEVKLFDALRAAFPRAETQGYPNAEPIFVIGMPRSGTTLIDRILSSHPQVTSAGELHNFAIAVKRLSGSRTRDLFDLDTVAATSGIDWSALGRGYIESTRPLTGSRLHFVDKLPHNFLYVGHILHALPNARVICLRRNPMDVCLSNFRQLFSPSRFSRYSFDLLNIGHYYGLFHRLMQHWQQAYPGRVLEIAYEDLVMRQDASTRMLLDYCGLPWHDGCLRFEHNDAPTATASAVQVRQAMQRSYMHRWRRYAAQLQPLRDLLESQGIPVAG